MPRGIKKDIPANEEKETELSVMALSSKGGKSTFYLVLQSVGVVSKKIYGHTPLMDTENDRQISYQSKAVAQGFIDGYTYAMSELEEQAAENE